MRNYEQGSSAPRYPDFICIGAQKAGTTWLHRALGQHSDIWLPPFKEIQYFSRIHIGRKVDRKSGQTQHDQRRSQTLLNMIESTADSALSLERKLAQIYCLSLIGKAELTDEWYSRIFKNSPETRLCGEISPDYALLPDLGVKHILRLQPNVKLLFILRDPIERGWSHLRMGEANGVVANIPHLQRISQPGFLTYSDYMTTIERFRHHVPPENFLTLFFDDITIRPRELLVEIYEFLGLDRARATFNNIDEPVYAGRRKAMGGEIYAKFRETFAPIYKRLLELDHPTVHRWYRKHYELPRL
jgi:hypothetical protein